MFPLRLSANRLATLTSTGLSLLGAGAFLAITTTTGDYAWVARLGGAGWVFLLAMIITMPTVTPWIKRVVEERGAQLAQGNGEDKMLPSQSKILVKDLVCGMEIEPAKAAGTSIYQGSTYYFCNLGCKQEFDKEPEKYLSAK